MTFEAIELFGAFADYLTRRRSDSQKAGNPTNSTQRRNSRLTV